MLQWIKTIFWPKANETTTEQSPAKPQTVEAYVDGLKTEMQLMQTEMDQHQQNKIKAMQINDIATILKEEQALDALRHAYQKTKIEYELKSADSTKNIRYEY